MDIMSLRNVSSGMMKEAVSNSNRIEKNDNQNMFGTMFQTALDNINTTNQYLSDAENAEIAFALGKVDNTHDLTIALQKASTALQYTVAVRDKFLEAYKEIMNMQI